ncbi:hypothetical protein HOLleu_27773 [Holothuria leucospilota]|uniref:Uncharacterized protein n=1 Tax=Holothuria leucospilota TaxID=206669 RepID=A0A9Q1H2K2_HOLLE|nr:hypothetical protein HOLleu_27773 [Holothuria leucospilota]
MIPNHPKLPEIKVLWQSFGEIMLNVKSAGTTDETSLAEKCKEWVTLFCKVYQAKDVTPYMHILMFHIPESIRIHGNINVFSQQGMEKMNDFVTSWYFRSSNHNKVEALEQILMKQNRTECLAFTCERGPRFIVRCGICQERGHNKRSCKLIR